MASSSLHFLTVLTEDDGVSGFKFERKPEEYTVDQLKRWLKYRGLKLPSKISPMLYRSLLLYFYFYLLNRLDHQFDPTYTSRIIVHGYLLKLLIKTVTVAVTACKSSHGQESYLRVLNGIFISKEYSILEKQKKNLIPKSIVS